jgi:hypothetical protein
MTEEHQVPSAEDPRLTDRDIHNLIDAEKLRLIIQRNITGIVSGSVVAVLVSLMLLNTTVPRINLIVWVTGYLIINALRLVPVVLFRGERSLEKNISFWKRITLIDTLMGGLTWGIGCAIIFPHGFLNHIFLLTTILLGMSVGGTTVRASDRAFMTIMLLAMNTPQCLMLLYSSWH